MANRVAFVTGGAGGIGQSICLKLAEAGHRVACNYIPPEREDALKWQSDLKSEGTDIFLVEGDVSSFQSSANMIKEAADALGPIEILVNCAGVTKDGTFKKMTEDQWNTVINVNLNSMFNVTRQVVDGMMSNGWGRIINISSMNGQKGQFGQSNYAATKAGIHGFTMSIAQELARSGITVNSVSPGYIGTKMVMAIAEEVREKIVKQIPVGRMGTPEEIGALCAFIASEDAGFMTGANIAVNGGQHMQF